MKLPQFSLRRMLVSVALIATAAALFKLGGRLDSAQAGSASACAYFLVPASLGAGIGVIFGRPFLGAFILLGLAVTGVMVVFLLFGGPHGVDYRR